MERRRDERIETKVHLTCRAPARPCRAILHDLSHGGGRLEFAHAGVELGSTTLIEIPGQRSVAGTIVWIHGNKVGVRFEQHLNKAAAVALGLEEPEPAPPSPADLPSFSKGPEGLLRHWFRRLTGL